MKEYNTYLKTGRCTLEERAKIFPLALIQWFEHAAGQTLVMVRAMKNIASEARVRGVQKFSALSFCRLEIEQNKAVFENRFYYFGETPPEQINQDVFPYDLVYAVGFDPAHCFMARLLQEFVTSFATTEVADMSLLKVFVEQGCESGRRAVACKNARELWGFYAMPSTIKEGDAIVKIVIPFGKSNYIFDHRAGADSLLAKDVISKQEYNGMLEKSETWAAALNGKNSKKRNGNAPEAEAGGEEGEHPMGGAHSISDDEEEDVNFFNTDGNPPFDYPVTVLQKYLQHLRVEDPSLFPPEQQAGGDIKLPEELGLLRDPIIWYYKGLTDTETKAVVDAAITGVKTLITLAVTKMETYGNMPKPVPPDTKVVWEPVGIQALNENAKRKILKILATGLFVVKHYGESSIMFSYACGCLDQAKILSQAIHEIVRESSCVDRLLTIIGVIDTVSRSKLANSDSIYEFFYSLGWIMLRELILHANEAWKVVLQSRRCKWTPCLSFWEKKRLMSATHDDEGNEVIVSKLTEVLEAHDFRVSHRKVLVTVSELPLLVGKRCSDEDGEPVGKVVVKQAFFSQWKRVFDPYEPEPQLLDLPVIKSGFPEHARIVEAIEKIFHFDQQLPDEQNRLCFFFQCLGK
jgi:hypothetical protein